MRSGFTFFPPLPALADIVDAVWDVDVPDAHAAGAMTFKVLPSVSPTLCVHYRAAARSNQRVNPGDARQRVTGIQTGAVTVRPTGALGAVIVHLKPEAAYRFVGCLGEFTDANVALTDLFGFSEVSTLEERLGEAAGAAERAKWIQAFLLGRLRTRASDAVVYQAVVELCRQPNRPVRQVASSLGISQRQLSRRFQAMVGTNLKQFARIARLGKAVACRRRGWKWGEIAHATGYTDQAHLIHSFKSMTGESPEALLHVAAQFRNLNHSLATSGFYNTLVT